MEYKFSELFKWTSGKPINPSEGEIPIYGSNGIIGYTGLAKYKNKIILGRVGAYCGSVAYCKESFNATDNTLITTCNEDNIIYSYAYYLLKSFNLNNFAGGAAQPLITQSILKRLKCDIPNIEIQHRIASILSTYDTLIENNTKRIRLLEKMAENLYKEWFVRFRFPGHENVEMVNGLPKGWKYVRLFDVANVMYGYAFKSNRFCYNTDLNPVVRIRDIQDNHTNTYTDESCDDKYLINKNAILIGMDGIFHMCLWNGERAYLNQRVVMLNSNNDNLCNYLLFMAIRPQIKYWEQVISGTTVAHLGDKHLRRVKVLAPGKGILEKANKLVIQIMDEKNSLQHQNSLLAHQRDLLLPRLMSGKLEVNS